MQTATTTQPGASTDADTVAVGVFEGEEPPGDAPSQLGALLSSGEARRSLKALGLTHVESTRWLVVGLGERVRVHPRARPRGGRDRARARA